MKPRYPIDAFAGTSAYYLRFRPPYPAELLKDLLVRGHVEKSDTLFDVACGPGRIALALASSFREVWAVDLEPEMIAEARREAARLGPENIRWHVGIAEEFAAPHESFKLVTIGDAFHRLHRSRMLELVSSWLVPRGSVAILGSGYTWRDEIPWHRAIARVIEKWTGQKAGVTSCASLSVTEDTASIEALLREFNFVDVSSFDFHVDYVWTIDSITGYLRSTSHCSERALGKNVAPFDDELRATLSAIDASGKFSDSLRFGYTFGRKA